MLIEMIIMEIVFFVVGVFTGGALVMAAEKEDGDGI